MISKFVSTILIFIFIIGVFTSFYLLNLTQQGIVYSQEKVVYTLPYPGILPDHPLYFLKIIRDKALDFVTRDKIKKANLYLLFSDKRVNMAIFLSKKGKNKLAVTTFSKGEKYFLKIPDLLTASKEQGVGPSPELVETLRVSNAKHRELANELLRVAPTEEIRTVEEILKINQQIKNKLKKL